MTSVANVALFYILTLTNAIRLPQENPDPARSDNEASEFITVSSGDGDYGEMADLGLQSVKIVKGLASKTRLPDRQPVTFIHEHKGAGTLICKLARAAGENTPEHSCTEGSNFTKDDYHQRAAPYLKPRVTPQRTCAERSSHVKETNLTFFSIEREVNQGDVCPNDFKVIGFMREPVNRLESVINFLEFTALNYQVMEHVPAWIIGCIHDGDCTPFQEWEHFDNYFVRQMGGATAMNAPPGGITEEHFQAAKAMMKNVHLMAPMECLFADPGTTGYKAVHDKFQSLVGWDVTTTKKVLESAHTKQFTSDEKKLVEELNKFDLKLYDELRAIYEC